MKFYFKANRKFLEQIRNKNVYGIFGDKIFTIKNNENENFTSEIIVMIHAMYYPEYECYVECDSQEEYEELQTKYSLFLLKQ